MNILIISDGAPKYYNFFNALAQKFHQENHKVFFAVDCMVSFDENKIATTGLPNRVFSEYFAKHKVNQQILDKYSNYNLNSALLSDYERAMVYNIWGRRDNEFYEKLKSALLSFFTEMLEDNKIDVVVYENVSNSFAQFCWFACQKHSVLYVGLTGSRLPGRFFIADDPLHECLRINATFSEILAGKIKPPSEIYDWCAKYIENIDKIVPDYMKFNQLDHINIVSKYLKLEKFEKIIVGIRHLFDDHYHCYRRGNQLIYSFNQFIRNLHRKLKTKKIPIYYSTQVVGERFLLYPMHFHPESSTSVLAGTYLDEFEVIRNIAFNLPQGFKLYVKDHPSAFGYPSLDFYKKLSNLPNVRILSHSALTKKLIKESQAVITLTSTVGYEALLLNKLVFLYGNVFYQKHQNVITVDNPARLHELLVSYLIERAPPEPNPQYNANFVVAYYMNTLPGILNFMQDERAASALANALFAPLLQYIYQQIDSKKLVYSQANTN